MEFGHVLKGSLLMDFLEYLDTLGVEDPRPFAKGTTSLIFRGRLGNREVVIKLQRPDSPRRNLGKEVKFTFMASLFGVSPPPLSSGSFKGLPYMIREFAEGEPILFADLEKKHLVGIALKTALLDRLGIDHGQIQGGKHIIIGGDVYIIDFEKSGFRRPKNLTSAMAMIFLGSNSISRRVSEKFEIDSEFKEEMKTALRAYKRSGTLSRLLELLSSL
ncbi:serine/threonine protein kinase [Thermococcus sp.]